jgi:hypothetical protein
MADNVQAGIVLRSMARDLLQPNTVRPTGLGIGPEPR